MPGLLPRPNRPRFFGGAASADGDADGPAAGDLSRFGFNFPNMEGRSVARQNLQLARRLTCASAKLLVKKLVPKLRE